MNKKAEEWFKQADYDIKSAEIMFENKQYIHAVFMCHLALEKALKGFYQKRLDKIPPKVHNLVFLMEKIGLELPEGLLRSVLFLNRASVATRYPEDLKRMLKDYNKRRTSELIKSAKETLRWLKRKLKE